MRNWNRFSLSSSYIINQILSYLWGIETITKLVNIDYDPGFYLTYEELKPEIVADEVQFLEILSYLWGIETQPESQRILQYNRFYLTYEELKQEYDGRIGRIEQGFYLTYEELKQRIFFDINMCYIRDFILPMRNWNQSLKRKTIISKEWFYLTYEELKPDIGDNYVYPK